MSNLQIDAEQLKGPVSDTKAAELGVVKTTALSTLQADMATLIDEKERGFQLLGVVLAASSQNFDLSTITVNTIDGITITDEGSACFYGQDNPVENGVYQWKASKWTRDPRFDEEAEIKLGNFFLVDGGTDLGKRLVVTSTGTGKKKAHIVGTDPISIEAKTLGLPVITPLKESGLTTKDALDTTNAGGEPTGYTLQKDYDHLTQVFIGVSPLLVGQTTGAMAYFSADSGATAKAPGNFQTGDELFVDASQAKVAFPTGKLVQLNGFKGESSSLGGITNVDYGTEQAVPGATFNGKQIYTRVIEFTDHTQVKLAGVDTFISGQPNTHPTTPELWMVVVDSEAGKPGSYYLLSVSETGTDFHYTKQTLTTPTDTFQSMQVDPVNKHIYYSKNGSSDLYRANLDGSGEVVLVSGVSANPIMFALDLENLHIYVAPSNTDTDPLNRYNLDGTGETLISSTVGSVSLGMRIYKGKLYYHSARWNRIQRINLDGSVQEAIFDQATPFRGFDIRDDKLYLVYNNRLYLHELDGTPVDDLGIFEAITAPLFVTNSHIYWYISSQLKRANLDNTDRVTILDVAPAPPLANISGSHYPVAFTPPVDLKAYKNLQNEVVISGGKGKIYAGTFKPEYTKNV